MAKMELEWDMSKWLYFSYFDGRLDRDCDWILQTFTGWIVCFVLWKSYQLTQEDSKIGKIY